MFNRIDFLFVLIKLKFGYMWSGTD